MSLAQVAEDLRVGPTMLQAASMRVQRLQDDVAGLEAALKRRRLAITLEVNEVINDDGKKRYTNEQARAAAAEERLATDEAYCSAHEKLEAARTELAHARIDLQFQRDRFDAAHSLARLLAGSVPA